MPSFELKTKLYLGCGERRNISKYLMDRNFSKCGLLVDAVVLESDPCGEIIDDLKKNLEMVKLLSFTHKGEPTYTYLDTVKDFFSVDEVDCLIGIGGGSVMDTAKGLAVLITNPTDKSVKYRGFPTGLNKPLPVITVPTIAGTGSEVTYNAVFIDESETRKLGINTTDNFPVFAVVDPELSVSAPLKQTLSTAFDCLVHALESFMSKEHTFITRPLSIAAFKYVTSGIEKILTAPDDIEGRTDLLKASYLAGIALFNSSGGVSTALSYPLGTFKHVPHGEAGGFFMQYILPHNLDNGYTEFYLLYDAIHPQNDVANRKDKSNTLVNEVVDLIERSAIPKRLSAYGVTEEDLQLMFDQVKKNLWPAVQFNPIEIQEEELKKLLIQIL